MGFPPQCVRHIGSIYTDTVIGWKINNTSLDQMFKKNNSLFMLYISHFLNASSDNNPKKLFKKIGMELTFSQHNGMMKEPDRNYL